MWSGPVSRIPCPPRERGAAAIPLGDALRRRSSNLPGCLVRSEDRTSRRAAASSLFGLAPDGVFQADASPRRRCALTAPFHPCLIPPRPEGRRRAIGGVFSVALSVGSPRLAVSKHPALWCSDFPPPAPPRPRPKGHGKRQQERQSRPWWRAAAARPTPNASYPIPADATTLSRSPFHRVSPGNAELQLGPPGNAEPQLGPPGNAEPQLGPPRG